MAQAATGQTWNGLFQSWLADELQMNATHFILPGLRNPRPSGGAVATASDYHAFLMAFHEGSLWPNTRQAMLRDHTLDLEFSYTPVGDAPWHYGLGLWRECPEPEQGGGSFSHEIVNALRGPIAEALSAVG